MNSELNPVAFILAFAGMIGLFVVLRYKNHLKVWLRLILGIAAFVPLSWLFTYEMAANAEDRLLTSKANSRAEVEGMLTFFFTTDASAALRSENRMDVGDMGIRYWLYGVQPLDVVYSEEEEVKGVYPAFE